eukprot:TRINITY_DN3220_c0_g1_i1.p1 TRINITY_DN3220_c0_g1~~TRINITY_DN3220_c0_g1_i1.p1  ORF type:complete len:529 (-),score=127.27 TRINITY_DN3220_c0_g1_i1:21-1607(-)
MENTHSEVTIIEARYVVPVVPERVFHENHALVISPEGNIIDILPIKEAHQKYPNPTKRFELNDDYCLIPGLINCHSHAAMSLLRGLADDVQLMDWLMHYMWPAEGTFVSADFVRVGSSITVSEMLRSGTTTVNDMYFFPEVTAKVVDEAGMRGMIGAPIIHFPSAYAGNIKEYFQKGKDLIDRYQDHPRVRGIFAPHAPYTVDDSTFLEIRKISDERNLKVHCHVHETKKEIDDHIADPTHRGARPIERLNRLGIFNEKLIAAHMTHMNNEEIQLVAKNGVHVVNCPESNLKLGSGICPVRKLLNGGANVCLGTDGPASNDDLDMLGEIRTSALVDKLNVEDKPLPAWKMLQMGTLNGAKALGLDKIIGSLEVGKHADVVAVKLRAHPIYNPITSLVYSGTNTVEYVWVNGKNLLEKRKLTTMDEFAVMKDASAFRDKILSWDRHRKKCDVKELEDLLNETQNASGSTDKDTLEKWKGAFGKANDSLFHHIFFASIGENVGTTSERLQDLAKQITSRANEIEGLLKGK